MIYFRSLNIFIMAILKSCFAKSGIWLQFQAISVAYCCLVCHIFLFLFMSHYFLLETGHFRTFNVATVSTTLLPWLVLVICLVKCRARLVTTILLDSVKPLSPGGTDLNMPGVTLG